MTRLTCFFVAALIFAATMAPPAYAQGGVPFTLRLEQNQVVSAFTSGGTVTLAADAVGVPSAASLTITYTGAGTAVIGAVDLLDQFNAPSPDFSVTGLPSLPLTLTQNQSVTVALRYLPATSLRSSARALFQYTEGGPINQITVNLVGTAPEFTYSYIPSSGNPAVLAPGGTVSFPATAVNSVTPATVVIFNKGSGPGVVNDITSAGPAFRLTGLPLPPAAIGAGRDLRFTVNYNPTAVETSQGSLQVELPGRIVSFVLSGISTGPVFVYETIRGSAATVVAPNQVIALPNTLVGDTASITFRVRNTGNADGQISTISVLGTGYQLSGLPFIPLTLSPGGSVSFTLSFAPAQPGAVAGRLRVGNDTFDLSSSGLGPSLTYAYTIASITTPIAPAGSVLFTPAPVGATASVRFSVSNTGTAAASVTSISIASTGVPVFTLADLPALPATVAPGATASFTVRFAPRVLGAVSATLRIDAQSFTLSGVGNPPAALPAYQFDGASGDQQPLQQPAVGLALASPYTLPLSGTLSLTFNSEVFSDDPAIQFATGGRTVSFTIPANSTRAVFPNGATQIRLQTGTVAGTITLTPSFVTDGGIDLTPQTPTSLNLNIRQAAPQILSVLLTAKTTNTFTLQVTGYATSRSITDMGFHFTAASGENVSTTSLTANVEATFITWYQSATSKTYGSQFSATIPFTLSGDVRSVTNLTDTIQSVAVTLTNRLGSSAARSVSLR